MLFDEAIRKLILLKRPNTRRSYFAAIDQWVRFLGFDSKVFKKAHFEAGNAVSALSWLVDLKEIRGLSDVTVFNRFVTIRKLYRHLCNIKQLKRNPFAEIEDALPMRQKTQVRPTQMIPFAKVAKILSLPDLSKSTGFRDAALLAVAFGAGLRRSEIRNLNCGDFRVSPAGTVFLAINGAKSGENQGQSVPEWVTETVSQLISKRKQEGASDKDPLFVTWRRREGKFSARRISDKTVWYIFVKYRTLAGLNFGSPHSARATGASLLKSQGFQDRDVQLFLRHKHPGMVAIYDKRSRGLDDNPGLKMTF